LQNVTNLILKQSKFINKCLCFILYDIYYYPKAMVDRWTQNCRKVLITSIMFNDLKDRDTWGKKCTEHKMCFTSLCNCSAKQFCLRWIFNHISADTKSVFLQSRHWTSPILMKVESYRQFFAKYSTDKFHENRCSGFHEICFMRRTTDRQKWAKLMTMRKVSNTHKKIDYPSYPTSDTAFIL
jgi:hypothetical protein